MKEQGTFNFMDGVSEESLRPKDGETVTIAGKDTRAMADDRKTRVVFRDGTTAWISDAELF